MIELSHEAVAALALVAGLWLAIALWASWRGLWLGAGGGMAGADKRTAALALASPAIPLVVARGGGLEGADRLAATLGLPGTPGDWSALTGPDGPFLPEEREALAAAAAEAAAGSRFTLALRVTGSSLILRASGGPAPPAWPAGSVLIWFQDATEEERQAEVHREEAGRLAAALDALAGLVEGAPFPIWHRGPDLALAMVNGAYVSAVEAASALEVIAQGIELVDDSASAVSQAALVRDRGEAEARTVPATIAGERRMMRVVEVPLGGSGVAGYAIDVEDREQARADLARFVRAQRDMLDRLSAGVAQFGRDRGLAFFNQPFARLFSLTGDFLADQPEFNRVLDAMREGGNLPEARDFPDWKQAKNGWFTSGLAADEEEWLLPGGKHLRVVAQPLPDGGLLVIFEDRTEQVQLASARDTLLRVRAATFDNLFEAVGVFASDGRLQMWNNRFRELWEFEEEHLAGRPRVDALTPHLAARLRNPAHASLVRELVRSATVERKQRSGRVSLTNGREFEFAAVPLPDGNALFTMLDVTDSRMVEAALREKNEALEAADRLKTAFVSNMSYELRTPLTSIAGFAEMLEGGYAGALTPPADDYVRAILESVARLSALIDNVLDLTQSDMGSLLLAEDEVDVAQMCREAAEAVRDAAAAKRIDFAIDLDPSAGVVTGDRRRLRQALGNIVHNAVAHSGDGARVLLHAAGGEAEAAISISDNGPGIAPAEQARVFDRFHRSAEARPGQAALGLGLPLARQFIEAHGGGIDLQSRIGEGTTVTIHLPRARS